MFDISQGYDGELKGEMHFNKKKSYICRKDGEVAGWFNLTDINGYISIAGELVEKYKGKGYGTAFLHDITEYVFKNYEGKNALLLIHPENTPSIKTAIKNGYKVNYMVFEDFENELPGFIPYVKYNTLSLGRKHR